MCKVFLFGVLDEGAVRIEIKGEHRGFDTLYDGLELGVYTAFRSFKHNCFLDLEHHLSRTRASMRRFGLKQKLDTRRLCRALHEVCSVYPGQDMRVRIDVLAAPAVTRGVNTTELIALAPFTAPNPNKYLRGVDVMTTRALQRDDPLTKTADYAQAREALMRDLDVEDCLLVNEHGLVLEGASSNFFALVDGALHTAGEGILEGITRATVLDLAARLGHQVRTSAVTMDVLQQATEAALSSSSRGIMPVVCIDGKPVGTGKPGPVITSLHRAYAAYVSRTVRPAVRN
jgi:branched-chain amino acid aminotransferase